MERPKNRVDIVLPSALNLHMSMISKSMPKTYVSICFCVTAFMLSLLCHANPVLAAQRYERVAVIGSFRSWVPRNGNVKLNDHGDGNYSRAFTVKGGGHRFRLAMNSSNEISFGAEKAGTVMDILGNPQALTLAEKGKNINFHVDKPTRLLFHFNGNSNKIKITTIEDHLEAWIIAPERVNVAQAVELDASSSILPPNHQGTFHWEQYKSDVHQVRIEDRTRSKLKLSFDRAGFYHFSVRVSSGSKTSVAHVVIEVVDKVMVFLRTPDQGKTAKMEVMHRSDYADHYQVWVPVSKPGPMSMGFVVNNDLRSIYGLEKASQSKALKGRICDPLTKNGHYFDEHSRSFFVGRGMLSDQS
jgi:hypothetical protein